MTVIKCTYALTPLYTVPQVLSITFHAVLTHDNAMHLKKQNENHQFEKSTKSHNENHCLYSTFNNKKTSYVKSKSK